MKLIISLLLFVGWGCFHQAAAQKQPETMQVQSSSWEYVGNEIHYLDVTINLPGTLLMTADDVLSNEKTGIITARGNVKIDYYSTQGLVEVTAHEVIYDRINRSGFCTQVTAQFGEEVYFEGLSLEILDGGNQFIVLDGELTACNQAAPQWSLGIKRTVIQREGYAFIRGAQFRVKNVPIFYFPFFIAPAMQNRRSGLLTPDTGSSERNGGFFGQPFYWAPRGDMDFTFTPYVYKDAGLRFDLEARYVPSKHTTGYLKGRYFTDDIMKDLVTAGQAPQEDGKDLTKNRFRGVWQHRQKTMGGEFRLDVEAGSDFSVDRDFLQEAARTRIRDYTYSAHFDRPLGRNHLSLEVNRLERILAQDEQVQTVSRLPDIRFYQPNLHLGSGFYVRNYAYATIFDVEDLGSLPAVVPEDSASPLSDRVMRLGLDSEISRTQNWVKFLHTRWGFRYQGAFYQLEDKDEEGNRGGGFAFLETVGPRLQKIYDHGKRRLVHYMDLGLTMKMGAEDEDAFLDSILFDELDIRIDEQVDGFQAAWRLSSRLFVGPVGKVRPLLDVEVRQDADFSDDESASNQPIETRFRLLNLGGFHGHGIFEVNPDTGTLDTLSVYTSVNRGEWTGYGGYVKRRPSAESFIGISQWNLRRWRSRFKIAIDYDFEKNDIKSEEFLYGYQGQCVGLALNYVRSPFDSSTLSARDYFQVTVNLRNLSELGSRF